MSNKEYVELLKTARENARRQYVLAKKWEDKVRWMEHSRNLLEKIYVAAMEAKND